METLSFAPLAYGRNMESERLQFENISRMKYFQLKLVVTEMDTKLFSPTIK